MDDPRLLVYREFGSDYQLVGAITPSSDGAAFSYDKGYVSRSDAHAISGCLPLATETFDARATGVFFDGLLPEGSMRNTLSEALHAPSEDFGKLLSRLNNESAGALVFCEEGIDPASNRRYEVFPFSELEEFASAPRAKALALDIASRLSLAGAQMKIGLFHEGADLSKGWFVPKGSAPSTHIVKASDGTFDDQTINEALCLETARQMGFDVTECALIKISGREPLLAVERFDRTLQLSAAFPHRLHQEDFCQAAGIASSLKYEPTDGHYLALASDVLSKASANPFGDRAMFFSRLLFDWAIGNCDNHLKNHSLLWRTDWSGCGLSPLYDITCTTRYPALAREMGISLCQSRKIDDVTIGDILASAKVAGLPPKMAASEFEQMEELFPKALRAAEAEIAEKGFSEVSKLADYIEGDFLKRFAAAQTTAANDSSPSRSGASASSSRR